MKDWKITTIEECTSILGDGLHGTPEYEDGGEYSFVNGNNLVDGKLIIKPDTKRVSFEQYEKYRKPLNERTIFVSINGTLGNVGIYEGQKVILGKSACYFNVKSEIDKTFIYYVVSTPTFKQYLETNATGTTIKKFSLKQMREYQFEIPKLSIQKKISNVLSSIDRKIEENRLINKNLEDQAVTIFKQLLENGDSCIESAIGTFPSDFEVTKVGQIPMLVTDYVANGSFASLKANVTLLQDPDFAYFIRNTDLKSDSYNVYVDNHSYEFLAKSKLFGGEIIISNVGDVGSVFLCPSLNKPMTLGNNIIMLRPDDEKLRLYLYIWFKHAQGQSLIQGIKGGSAQPKFNKTDFKNLLIAIPSEMKLSSFNETVSPIFKAIDSNSTENKKLISLRDTLLPKLMSGKLDVSKIDI